MKSEHQQIAEWLLKILATANIPFSEGGNAPVVVRWLNGIKDGTIEVAPAVANDPIVDAKPEPEAANEKPEVTEEEAAKPH